MGFIIDNSKYGHLMPQEDYFIESDNIFCVADGVTRDSLILKEKENPTMEEQMEHYPNPSGASLAAETFCKSFVQFLKDKSVKSEESIREAFIFANNQIKILNDKYIKERDYQTNEYYSCVAVGCAIVDRHLFWGAICDCGIAVYDGNLNLKFRTPDYMADFYNYGVPDITRTTGFNTKVKVHEYRKVKRQYYQNKIKMIDGRLVSYGVLNGEQGAEDFINVGKLELECGDIVLLYSDGFEGAVYNIDFMKYLIANFNDNNKIIEYSKKLSNDDYNKYGKERTLIKYKIDDMER